jgi:hypothetical protein
MEFSTLYNGVPLAKCELLARLKNNRLPTDDLRVRTAVVSRVPNYPWEQRSSDIDEPDDEPAEAAPVSRRQRKRSLAKVCEAARKAGADRVIVDGAVIVLSPAAPESVSLTDSPNEWDAVLPGVDHGPH